MHQEASLNIDLGINNERQDYKLGTVGVYLCAGRVNEGNNGEGIWLMDFI
jgi:hypothetical protein